jgi:protein-S-isoprenylcysteine O-methyltransferase Ste14
MNILGTAWKMAFWWLAAINLAAFGFALLTMASPTIKGIYFKAPKFVQKLEPFFFMVPLWMLPLAPQPTLTGIPLEIALPAGLICLLAALFIWWSALRTIGFIPAIRALEGLACSSIYGMVRHPIYLGNVLSVLSMALIFRAAGALLCVPVVLAIFLGCILVEERGLRAEYGEEYAVYVKKVKYRLIPGLF